MLGGVFLPEEEKRGDRVVILSHSLWQRRFGSDPDLIGKSLTLYGVSFTLVGMMTAGFDFPSLHSALVPIVAKYGGPCLRT